MVQTCLALRVHKHAQRGLSILPGPQSNPKTATGNAERHATLSLLQQSVPQLGILRQICSCHGCSEDEIVCVRNIRRYRQESEHQRLAPRHSVSHKPFRDLQQKQNRTGKKRCENGRVKGKKGRQVYMGLIHAHSTNAGTRHVVVAP